MQHYLAIYGIECILSINKTTASVSTFRLIYAHLSSLKLNQAYSDNKLIQAHLNYSDLLDLIQAQLDKFRFFQLIQPHLSIFRLIYAYLGSFDMAQTLLSSLRVIYSYLGSSDLSEAHLGSSELIQTHFKFAEKRHFSGRQKTCLKIKMSANAINT